MTRRTRGRRRRRRRRKWKRRGGWTRRLSHNIYWWILPTTKICW